MSATAQYRLVHFVPDPFSGGRVPIGALIQRGDDLVIARSEAAPAAACVGGSRGLAALRMILSLFDSIDRFDALPRSFGPHVALSPSHALPTGITDPAAWVTQNLLPKGRERRILSERGPTRATLGYQFFKTWRVDRHVRKQFTPGDDLPGWLDVGHGLKPVTHWVAGKSKVLLMEPIVVDARRENVRDEVREVITKFWAYRGALRERRGDSRQTGELVAYVVGPGSRATKESVVAELKDASDVVFDSTRDESRRELLARIESVAASP